MADERSRTKSELKYLFANLKAKPINEDMIGILIDVLWRDRITQRTSGFEFAGSWDSEISFDEPTRTFTINPFDPLQPGFTPHYAIYSWASIAVYQRRYGIETIQIPDEEGLYCIYFDKGDDLRQQVLKYIKNPTATQLIELYNHKVIISFVYWVYRIIEEGGSYLLSIGDDRHGSEWNPQIHQYLHKVFFARRESGLQIINLLINQDGSLDTHAQFAITDGVMLHDDISLDRTGTAVGDTIPVLYFSNGLPRYTGEGNFAVAKGASRLYYNITTTSLAQVNSDNFCLYHIFATNEHFYAERKIISVMGTEQYASLADAFSGVSPELDIVTQLMPQQGRCYLGSLIFEVKDSYTNSVHARIVAFASPQAIHPPVTIAPGSTGYLGITEEQELSFLGDIPSKPIITQTAHGLAAEDAIRHNETIFVKAQADSSENAQTCGIVSEVIDADNFRYVSDGFLPGTFTAGKEYFLSPTTAGLVMEQETPETWTLGQVRQSLGFGTPQGLKVEIDVGDEIGSNSGPITEVLTEMSVTGDASTLDKIKLVNDEDTPAALNYYGTDSLSAKGFHVLPSEAVQALSGATPTFDLDLGRGATITLSADTTITFSNLVANDTGHIEVLQDGTGGWTLNFAGATIEIALNSYQAAGEVKLTGALNSKDIVVYWYTGSFLYFAVIYNLMP